MRSSMVCHDKTAGGEQCTLAGRFPTHDMLRFCKHGPWSAPQPCQGHAAPRGVRLLWTC
ncbi:General transcription factor II-I repeat domain-containing protein 1, partial [Clarias magur]